MAHSLAPAATAATPIFNKFRKPKSQCMPIAFASQRSSQQAISSESLPRRTLSLGLVGAVLGMTIIEQRAQAGKRAAPPPPQEKKDLSVSGVHAKVIASKKRKEAMKQAVAKLRERGKVVEKPDE